MPKSQYIDPKEMRKAGEITFTPIPVNQYKKSVKDELKSKNFTKEDLKRIYRDMVVIREFETMLQLVKTTGGYNGVEYNNPGPAHLSAGQEAAAVGMAYMLNIDDFIFGSHRSHGEILGWCYRQCCQESFQRRFCKRPGYPLPALRSIS